MSRYKFRGKSYVDYHNSRFGNYSSGFRLDGTRPTTRRDDEFRDRNVRDEPKKERQVELKMEQGGAYREGEHYIVKINSEFGCEKSVRALGVYIGEGFFGKLTEEEFVGKLMGRSKSLILFDEFNDHFVRVKTRDEFLEFRAKNRGKTYHYFHIQDIGVEEAVKVEKNFAANRTEYSNYALESVRALEKSSAKAWQVPQAGFAPAPGEFTQSAAGDKGYGVEFYPDTKTLRVLGEVVKFGDSFDAQKLLFAHKHEKPICVVYTRDGRHYILETEAEVNSFERTTGMPREQLTYFVLKPIDENYRHIVENVLTLHRPKFGGYKRADGNV